MGGNTRKYWKVKEKHELIDNFMKSWRQKSRTERNENFFEEMEHNLFLLMKQMEKNENGGYQLWNR